MKDQFTEIFSRFNASGTLCDAAPIGSGHIHATFLLRTSEPDAADCILQKINHQVFTDVNLLMNNIQHVTQHLQQKRISEDGFVVLEVVRTKNGQNYLVDALGNFWRMFLNVQGSISYDKVPNTVIAYEAGKAYGHFLYSLHDFPVQTLQPVIPEFHSLSKRFRDFEKAVENDPANRKSEVKSELELVYSQIDEMKIVTELEKQGRCPLRVTHNDTKINNVLFNAQGKAICVIDLDTVMPGLSLYDFGDAIRTAAATAAEDEQDLSKMKIDLQIFEAFTKGFLEKTHGILTQDEISYLAFSCRYITFIQGIRFLTDFLDGDKYYKTSSENHNLFRARAQFKLAESMREDFKEMQGIVMNGC
ncbi:MAG: aminoglycoside phosphotransferase family protein [Bacteroidales bacterium]|nr:aminoglycoside phosphotransferase family protein [Bacteroidales bacterium]